MWLDTFKDTKTLETIFQRGVILIYLCSDVTFMKLGAHVPKA